MNSKIDQLRAKANSLVEKPGVYLMKNKQKDIIYIGKAKRLKNRVVSYFRQNKGHNEKVRKMVSMVDDFEYIVTDSEFEALVLECSLIKQYSPKYNILLKDSKGYHYVQITNEPFPRIRACKQKIEDGSIYLGPYTSSFAVTQAAEQVNSLFMLPTCSKNFPAEFKKSRPCLNFYIKKCMGVCQGKISQTPYRAIIEEAVSYLENGSSHSITQLKRQMEEAAEQLDFEKAAKLRDRIAAIQKISETQKVMLTSSKDQDFIGIEQMNTVACIAVLKFRNGSLHDKDHFFFDDVYDKEELLTDFLTQYYQKDSYIPKFISLEFQLPDYSLYEDLFTQIAGHKIKITVPQKGESKQLITMAKNNALEELSRKLEKKSKEIVACQELGQLLGLSKIPEYIESYDISNIGNDYMVAGMIVFENARPYKAGYKKFSIKDHLTQDDYACMKEVITRRFQHYLDPNETDAGFKRLPDLILLDGGKGHVATIEPVLRQMGIHVPVYGMVKDSKHKTRAIAVNGGEIQISTYKSAFRLVTQIQDEVHRFAISYQRKKHQKNTFTLELTSVKGIGEKKAMALLKQFKTKAALKSATPEELKQAAKISDETALLLYETIQNW